MENTTKNTSKYIKNLYVKNVTLLAVKKEIILDILRAKNIIQQIQHKYNNNFINAIVVRFIVIEHHFLITKRNAL